MASVQITKAPGTVSQPWVASSNPIQFFLQRQDYEVVSVINNGGFADLEIQGGLVSTFTPAQEIYIGVIGYNKRITTPGGATLVSGNTIVPTGEPYNGNFPGYVNRAVYDDTYYIIVTCNGRQSKLYVDDAGNTMVDVSSVFQSLLSYPDLKFVDVSQGPIANEDIYLQCEFEADGFGSNSPTGAVNNDVYVLLSAKQVTDDYRNKLTLYWSGDTPTLGLPDQNQWAQLGGGLAWVLNTYWTAVNLNVGASTKEMQFVNDRLRKPGRYWFTLVFSCDVMGGPLHIGRVLFYDYQKLVHTYEFDIVGSEGDPVVQETHLEEIEVPYSFTSVRFQLFHVNGSTVTVNFELEQLIFRRQQLPLSLMNRFVMWRGWPFTFSFIMPDLELLVGKLISKQYEADGTLINTMESDALDTIPSAGSVNRVGVEREQWDNKTPYLHDSAKLLKLYIELASVQLSDSWYIDVREECQNPLLLCWKNSLGGDQWWMFQYIQDTLYTYEDGRKTKRMILYADSLTPDQYDAINDMNRPTTIYEVPSEDFDTDVRTTAQNGTSVFIVEKNGTKTGVVVIPTESRYNNRSRTRSISITIELPHVFTT